MCLMTFRTNNIPEIVQISDEEPQLIENYSRIKFTTTINKLSEYLVHKLFVHLKLFS